MQTNQFLLASRPYGMPTSGNFRLETTELPELNDNEVLLKSWYISVDPYMRSRMNDLKSYAPSFELNKPIRAHTVAKVIRSRNLQFSDGDIIVGLLPWAEYCIESAEKLRKIIIRDFSPGYYLGILGMPGFTAYFGIMDICKPQVGETAVISGAAGAVGLVAGQIAKISGARVIGIAGGDEKCRMIREQYGFDDALDYKTSRSIRKELRTMCPEGVDVYFDNVGGEITEGVVSNLNFHSRIALCGQISQYNSTKLPPGNLIMSYFLTRSVKLQGFIVSNYKSRFGEALDHLTTWMNEGKLKFTETIVEGFENLPEAFLGLFSGKNTGKMLVKTE